MGDWMEQLLKTGLVNEDEARRERRLTTKRLRRRRSDVFNALGVVAEAAPAPDEDARRRASKLASGARLDGRHRGPRRWYFVSRGGHVPYIEVSDEGMALLAAGDLALVESPAGEVWLIDGETAAAIAPLDPTWLRVWNLR